MGERTIGRKWGRFVRFVAGTWTGVVLIGLIIVYLSFVSVLTQTHPRLIERLLRTSVEKVYTHWLLIALGAALCVSLLAATLTRIPPDLIHAGAWCSHLGVIILGVGATWYVCAKEAGLCATSRTVKGWTPIDRFYLDHSAAVYVSDPSGGGEPHQTPLPIDPTAGTDTPQELDVTLLGAPQGVEIRATQFLPRAPLIDQWDNDFHDEIPAVRVEFRSGEWKYATYIPFDFRELTAPQRVQIPGRGVVGLQFSRQSRKLPGTLQVDRAEYLTYPASVVPKDYRCEITIVTDRARRDETLSLNHPVKLGRYQIHHSSWLPVAEHPMMILFSVASRPGLPVIWAGAVMIALGFPYAFYVRPLLTKRRSAKR